jgi:hypothetical protein
MPCALKRSRRQSPPYLSPVTLVIHVIADDRRQRVAARRTEARDVHVDPDAAGKVERLGGLALDHPLDHGHCAEKSAHAAHRSLG